MENVVTNNTSATLMLLTASALSNIMLGAGALRALGAKTAQSEAQLEVLRGFYFPRGSC